MDCTKWVQKKQMATIFFSKEKHVWYEPPDAMIN